MGMVQEQTPAVPASRRWRWVPVLLGALVLILAVEPVGGVPFYSTPLILGLVYLAAAAVGGRRATLWAPGLVITVWGAAVVAVFSDTISADFTAVAITALGVGATAAALLGRIGFGVDALSVGLSVLFAGLTQLIASLGLGILGYGWFYGVLLGVWVLSDLTGLSPLLRGGAVTRSGRPTTPLR
ncbi:MAG: hypothetical protein H0T66_00025 [Geodermatophilaceae bacterium]|nr:hypothetical protein [Geodermatophilaceae bacterium]